MALHIFSLQDQNSFEQRKKLKEIMMLYDFIDIEFIAIRLQRELYV